MKLLYYTKYTRSAGSSRLRSFQYFPLLEHHGCTITASALFNERYLKELYGRKKINRWNVAKQYFLRFKSLFAVAKYDLVIIEKELFPFLPAVPEQILSIFGIKYIVDYDDAIFHNYDRSSNTIIRFFLKNKIDIVMRRSALVLAGNNYLQQRAITAGAKNIMLLPTVIDKNKYKRKKSTSGDYLVIGWIGTPITAKYLLELKDVFTSLLQNFKFKIHIIGGMYPLGISEEAENIIEWSEETEVDEIVQFDVGIMPLKNSEWEMGKCAYKLIQYMACGIPVIGTNIGVNATVIKDGCNGFLVETTSDWYQKLQLLLTSKELRQQLGEKGYNTVMENYTLQSVVDGYLHNIQSLVDH